MRICQCTLRVCKKDGPCDVQNAVETANQHRHLSGKPPLENKPKDIERAVGTFYLRHKAETGKTPCKGCMPLVRAEVAAILANKPCDGVPRLYEEA